MAVGEGQAAGHVGVELRLCRTQRAEAAGGGCLGGGHDGGGDRTDFHADAAWEGEPVRLDREVEGAGGDLEGFVAKRNAAVPIGHMGEGWDVAHAALFLASDEAKYVTATFFGFCGRNMADMRKVHAIQVRLLVLKKTDNSR